MAAHIARYSVFSVESFLHRTRRTGGKGIVRGATIMATRPMMNTQRTITRADVIVVSALLGVAMLLIVLAQALGFTLL